MHRLARSLPVRRLRREDRQLQFGVVEQEIFRPPPGQRLALGDDDRNAFASPVHDVAPLAARRLYVHRASGKERAEQFVPCGLSLGDAFDSHSVRDRSWREEFQSVRKDVQSNLGA